MTFQWECFQIVNICVTGNACVLYMDPVILKGKGVDLMLGQCYNSPYIMLNCLTMHIHLNVSLNTNIVCIH